MGEFGGWDMPIQYSGILQEHEHTRKKAGIFDICHMGEFELSGPTAASDLERLLTLKVSALSIGQCRYGFMLNEAGGVIDDLTCYRLGDERYMLVVNAGTAEKDAAWILAHLSGETSFVDRSDELAKLDVQGPQSRRILEEVFGAALPDLGYFKAVEVALFGVDTILSRTGYTGEWGYEIYLPMQEAGRFWKAICGHAEVEPVGLGARDTLRLEMGYSLYGHEVDETATPVAASRGAFMAMDKAFIGKEAVEAELNGPTHYLVGLQLETKRAARAHDRLYVADRLVGEVTSGSLAPSLGCAVAMAKVTVDCAVPGTQLEVDIRGKRQAAVVISLPFYTAGSARG
jgi:aminomethyltransferase